MDEDSKLKHILNKYESIMDKSSKKLELFIDKVEHHADQGIDAFMNGLEFIMKKIHDLVESIIDLIYAFLNKDTRIAKLMRYISFPLSVVIPTAYKYFFYNRNGRALIFKPGVHLIVAKVGGGKSLASFILAEIYLEETGLGSYFTSPVEKPQVTKDGEWLYVHHRVINLNNYYQKGKKIKDFNTKKHHVIFKDERYLDYPPRNNKSTIYNDRFIPEHLDELIMRHKGMTHIYKFSQHPKLDSVEMEALTYMHEVETKKDIPIRRWLDTGKFDYIPIKLKFTTYALVYDFSKGIKRKKVGSCNIRIPYELLERFDTHAERYRNSGLPVDFK